MPEGNPDPGEGQPGTGPLSYKDDPDFLPWLKKQPGFSDLFAEKPDKEEPPAKAELKGGGQKVAANQAGDTMSELVSVLVKGLKAQAREEVRGETSATTSRTPPPPRTRTARQRFWGLD